MEEGKYWYSVEADANSCTNKGATMYNEQTPTALLTGKRE